MPRYRRIILQGCPHHLTQRGNHRQTVFLDDEDRRLYLDLVKINAQQCGVQILGYCLMSNHVHWIVTPASERSLAEAFGRAHCRYAFYFQAKQRTTGHLWQNRFYSCPLSEVRLGAAMMYIEQNPVRSQLCSSAEEYTWSSAHAHMLGYDPIGLVDGAAWALRYTSPEWHQCLQGTANPELVEELKRCTYGGKPFGGEEFRHGVSVALGINLALRPRGRPSKQTATYVSAKIDKC
jgi:putative transposase